MVHLSGSAEFFIGSDEIVDAPKHSRRLPPFWIDRHEVTIAAFSQASELNVPSEMAGKPAMNAIALVTYDEALAWAEASGKRIPTEAEFEFAATGGGTKKFPWDGPFPDLSDWPAGTVSSAGYDRTATDPPIVGLYSNVAEWTSTWMQHYPAIKSLGIPTPYEPRDHRVVRGAPPSVIDGAIGIDDWDVGPRQRVMCARSSRKDMVGFRAARSAKPHLKPDDFERIIADDH